MFYILVLNQLYNGIELSGAQFYAIGRSARNYK